MKLKNFSITNKIIICGVIIALAFPSSYVMITLITIFAIVFNWRVINQIRKLK